MRNKIWLALILIAGFAVRIFSILLLKKHITPEIYEYNTLALNIVHGKGYIYGFLNTPHQSFCYPGYSYLLAFFHYLMPENYFAIEVFQALVSVIACGFIYLIAKRMFDEKTALIASFLASFHPGLIIYTTKIHDLSLVVFFVALILWLIISLNAGKISGYAAIGAVIGLSVLTRPTLILFIPVYFLYNWFAAKNRKDFFIGCAVVSICAALVLAPWTFRNYRIHKKLIFITTTSAEHFWRGNNAFSSGTSLTGDRRPITEVAPKEFLEKLYKMKEIEQYNFLYQETSKFIAAHPVFFLERLARKFYYFWWFSPQTGLLYPGLWTKIYKIYYAFIFILFAAGICRAIGRTKGLERAAVMAIVLFLFLVSLGNSVYYVELRHRWAMEPLMLIFTAYAISGIFTYYKGPGRSALDRP